MIRNSTFKAVVITLALGLFLFAASPVFADCFGDCMAQNDCAQIYSNPIDVQICEAAWSAGCWWGCMY
jgi:hypothetical protein